MTDVYKQQRRVKGAILRLQGSPMFAAMSGILIMGKNEVLDKINGPMQTAYTDGVDTYYAASFVERLDNKQLAGLVAHEGLHRMMRHTTQWAHLRKRDPQLCNIAMDFVVNDAIVASDQATSVATLPPGACHDVKYRGWSVQRVFDDLVQNGKGKGTGTIDNHDEFDRELTPEERAELERTVDLAMRMGQRISGTGAGALEAIIDDLKEPAYDTYTLLAEFVSAAAAAGQNSTWRRPNRRFAYQGLYLPSSIGETLEEPVVTLDTSGSVWGSPEELAAALGGVRDILRSFSVQRLHIVYWDDGVRSHEVYDTADETVLTVTRPKGGGGTSFAPVLKYLRDHNIKPSFLMTFTDGYIGDWGKEPGCPSLWVMSTDVVAPWGRTIRA